MNIWIQSADFTTEEYDLDERRAKALFIDHDWFAEIRERDQREKNGLEACDPGFGLVRNDGRILHICPDDSSSTIHYHRPERILGLFWSKNKVVMQEGVPTNHVPEIIENFFRRQDDLLEEIA